MVENHHYNLGEHEYMENYYSKGNNILSALVENQTYLE